MSKKILVTLKRKLGQKCACTLICGIIIPLQHPLSEWGSTRKCLQWPYPEEPPASSDVTLQRNNQSATVHSGTWYQRDIWQPAFSDILLQCVHFRSSIIMVNNLGRIQWCETFCTLHRYRMIRHNALFYQRQSPVLHNTFLSELSVMSHPPEQRTSRNIFNAATHYLSLPGSDPLTQRLWLHRPSA